LISILLKNLNLKIDALSKQGMPLEAYLFEKEPIEENQRSDWEELFLKANAEEAQELLIPDVFEDESFDDYQW